MTQNNFYFTKILFALFICICFLVWGIRLNIIKKRVDKFHNEFSSDMNNIYLSKKVKFSMKDKLKGLRLSKKDSLCLYRCLTGNENVICNCIRDIVRYNLTTYAIADHFKIKSRTDTTFVTGFVFAKKKFTYTFKYLLKDDRVIITEFQNFESILALSKIDSQYLNN